MLAAGQLSSRVCMREAAFRLLALAGAALFFAPASLAQFQQAEPPSSTELPAARPAAPHRPARPRTADPSQPGRPAPEPSSPGASGWATDSRTGCTLRDSTPNL